MQGSLNKSVAVNHIYVVHEALNGFKNMKIHKRLGLIMKICKTRSKAQARKHGFNIIWASTRETLTDLLANKKVVDQPEHPRSLISAFFNHFFEK